ncbi:probable ATP-dependent RNA helicase DDX43 isoform X2 [Phymastichus coffea]|nr:probable ATP-dependent RNA helicase DDX43 isoform X2 [Phymastichus coffea]XP_058804199.1 probable ATP-dependent RNA helicase DDX43 isoform X2 [Phymastichus coffea]
MEENWDNDSGWNRPKSVGQNGSDSNVGFNNNCYKPSSGQRNHQTRNNHGFNQSRGFQQDRRYNQNHGFTQDWGSNQNRNDRRNQNSRHLPNSREEKCTVFIETSKLGKLIGRGGSQIRELQDQSSARINIEKDCVNGDSTLVIITGPINAQNKAKALIDALLADLPTEHNSSTNLSDRTESLEKREGNSSEEDKEINWTQAALEYEQAQQEKWAQYGPIKKDFYKEDPKIANLSEEEVEQIRKENNQIKVQHTFDVKDSKTPNDFKIPNPIETFEQVFRPYPDILMEIAKQGFQKPSPIQCQAWPILLSGKDMIGIAQTGTGKTLAFLLPALIHIDNQEIPRDKRSGPSVLVMAPTRELALQIEKEVNKYDYHGIKAVCVYGGGNRKEQMNIVSKGVEIVIATPGRLNDLVQTGVLDVKCVSYLVLDEADRMLDMGFEPQIRKTLLDVRPDRQSVMTSATWPAGVRRLAQTYMQNPVTVCVGSLDLKATHSVTQIIHIVTEEEKTDMLLDFLHNMGPDDKVIVFFAKKTTVDDVGSNLALRGVINQSIHGGREQSDREQALEDIKSGQVRILLATDVASRGLDIEDITHVFNYDFPKDIGEYVHRVGRTGRAGRTGESISLVTRKDWGVAEDLIKILEEAEQEIPDELCEMSKRFNNMLKQKSEERDNDHRDGRRQGGRRDSGRDRYGGGGGRRW